MKKFIKALWHGFKAVFTAIVDWVATLFGMKEESKYGRVMRRIVSTAFTAVVVFWAVEAFFDSADSICWELDDIIDCSGNEAFLSEEISKDLDYYDYSSYDKLGYLADAKGKKVLKNVAWITKPMKGDSLVCYSDGEHRGFFHMRDGHVVVPPVYDHAWIFSEGLAGVEKEGRVMFINTQGDIAIQGDFAYDEDCSGYVFHQGHCAVHQKSATSDSTATPMGIIDRTGAWVLPPVYDNIIPIDTFWVVDKGNLQGIFTFGLKEVMPLTDAHFAICDTTLEATFADHSISTYTLQGQLIAANLIYEVEQMMYNTREMVYPQSHSDEEEEYSDGEPYTRKAVATCQRYQAEWGWYGLLGPDGKTVTPPIYSDIEAIGKDLYLCKPVHSQGVILNSQGHRVE